ncbi:MAG: glycyl-radical enzyme activating protein [Deltaproteobacteria bacterium]|nr:glycyl-radical enzyme activating protein [Deltaproteobacteria bacterium]
MNRKTKIRGSVLRIERTSIHDGKGLRTVLFLKGCPLRCQWCSTPESQRIDSQKGYVSNNCIGCGTCVEACPHGALVILEDNKKVHVDFSKCKDCFTCVEKCLNGANKKYGKYMSVQQVVQEITKDEIFYFHSKGGVTISGGEPLFQPDFVAKVLQECRKIGIHTAVETSLYARLESIETILPWLNALYVDIKLLDRKSHKKWTGLDNTLILDNIQKIDNSEYPLEIIIRIPLIPGVNDSELNLSATAKFCKSIKKLKEIELLPYHRLGIETYRNLGLDYSLKDLASPSSDWVMERSHFLNKQNIGIPIRVAFAYNSQNQRHAEDLAENPSQRINI